MTNIFMDFSRRYGIQARDDFLKGELPPAFHQAHAEDKILLRRVLTIHFLTVLDCALSHHSLNFSFLPPFNDRLSNRPSKVTHGSST
jgi:hypothetical protein